MKHITLLSIGIVFFFYNATAQVTTHRDSLIMRDLNDTLPPSQRVEVPTDDNQVFQKVDKEAGFPGNNGAWKTYLEENLRAGVPVTNGAPAGTYQVLVIFIVSKDGSISNVRALTHKGYGMEEEVVRIIKKGPKWTPGMQNGRYVNSYRKQPVTFLVENQ
jgi:protein TonB